MAKGKIQRLMAGHYLDVSGDLSEDYAWINLGVTDLTIDMGPVSDSETYIGEKSATTMTSGYEPTAPVTAKAYKGDEVFEYVNDIRRYRKVGPDSITYLVNVDVYEDGTVDAERQRVNVQIDSYGGEGGGDLEIGYTLNYVGDPDVGKWDAAGKKFTKATTLAGTTGASTSGYVVRAQDVLAEEEKDAETKSNNKR